MLSPLTVSRISSRKFRIRKGLIGSPEKHPAKKKKVLFLDKPLMALNEKLNVSLFLGRV
jgi:hypothetical protein